MRLFCFLLLWVLLPEASIAQAEEVLAEKLYVRGGKLYQGLLLEETARQLEFAEIVRPPGKPMYAIIRVIDPREVSRYLPLEPDDKARLREQFNVFRNRALIEAGRSEALQVTSVEREGEAWLQYRGPWFSMVSTADDHTTRRAIVRLEQVFRAYRQVLPPRRERASDFNIRLYGSGAEYRSSLEQLGVAVAHPAYYSVERNQIVAGTDLDRFAAELAKATQENERTRQQLRNLRSSHEQTLAQVSSDMKRAGLAPEEIEAEVRARRSAWKQQQAKLEEAIEQADRRNALKLEDVARNMFRRLSHEAFHAYLENYVYPHSGYDVPRWLNEGLAQVFETAQLDGDTLRIDAPARELLQRLQADLKSSHPLPLAAILADDQSLLTAHGGSEIDAAGPDESTPPQKDISAAIGRRYLYAWGLAYHLAFTRSGLGTKAFESYVAKQARNTSPILRFERLVEQPLLEFERDWRAEMLRMNVR